MDATQRCWKQCRNGLHTECPADEECFAQADCKNGVITQKPSSEPTPMPFDGTRAPTISPKPTNSPTEPQPTESPVFEPTESPVFEPSYAPTTPFPTPRPTYGVRKYLFELCFVSYVYRSFSLTTHTYHMSNFNRHVKVTHVQTRITVDQIRTFADQASFIVMRNLFGRQAVAFLQILQQYGLQIVQRLVTNQRYIRPDPLPIPQLDCLMLYII